MNSSIPWIQAGLTLLTLLVVGLILPLLKSFATTRTQQIADLHARLAGMEANLDRRLDRLETHLDRHLEWHAQHAKDP